MAIQRAFASHGVNTTLINGHSIRIGAATTAA